MIQLAATGDHAAIDLVFPLLYDDLHRIARSYFSTERSDHTLQPTAIVHEAYIKLIQGHSLQFQNRAHFLALSAIMMRRVLVEQARSRRRIKRGGKAVPLELNEDLIGASVDLEQILDVDTALVKLDRLDARQARIVELRFFGGLSMEEVATVLDVSLRTAESDWYMARAWLKRELSGLDT
ncbi:MAG: ECF-type sigma factor [Pseudobdellovibrionaceae bacterium]|nr:ECF-type sigma factor [Pseudobdellovibrionaceae bacterium]